MLISVGESSGLTSRGGIEEELLDGGTEGSEGESAECESGSNIGAGRQATWSFTLEPYRISGQPCCFQKPPVSILTRWGAQTLAGPGNRYLLLPNGEQWSGEAIKLYYRITACKGQRMQVPRHCVGNLLTKKQLAITFITSRIQVTICYGVLHGALVLVRMGAIREMAVVDERPQVAKETGDFLRFYVP